MKLSRLFGISIMLSGLLLFITCRKMDNSPPTLDTSAFNTIVDKFFNTHRSSDEIEKSLVNFLKRVNEGEKFVVQTAKLIGFPRWDKILKPSFSRSAGRMESDSSVDLKTFTFTLVTDSTSYVLMISDSLEFRNFVNTWLDTDKHLEDFGTFFYDTYNVAGNGLTIAQKEKNLLEVLLRILEVKFIQNILDFLENLNLRLF